MKIDRLKPNKNNPRKISESKLLVLEKSLEKFGDLSGFVYNRRTKALVSGHQRTKTLPEDAEIKITKRHKEPTKAFTVAEGHIMIGEEQFSYREVDAPEEWEMEALLAANKHGGEWDNEKLRLNFADFPDMDISLTGFDIPELSDIGIEIESLVMPDIGLDQDTQTDESYVRDTPTINEEIDTENPNLINYEKKESEVPGEVTDIDKSDAFEEVEEKEDIVGKRFVIIIDCKDNEHKKQIREKIRPLVEEAEGNFF